MLLVGTASLPFSNAFSVVRLYSSPVPRRQRSPTMLASFHSASTLLNRRKFMIPIGLDESMFDEDETDNTNNNKNPKNLLSYLPYATSLPPLTHELFTNATENYVRGAGRPLHVWDVIRKEYRSYDVPLQLGNVLIDVRQTGEQDDESVAELLSLAALHRLPKEITLELLGPTTVPPGNSSLDVCREAFAVQGWQGVDFPKGLALFPKRRYMADVWRAKGLNRFRLGKLRIEWALHAVAEAQTTVAPPRQRSRAELLASIEQQLGALSESEQISVPADTLLYFPDSAPPLPWSWKRLKRLTDKLYAKLKSQGRVGILAYCFFNFVFYTVGILWQWPRVAPGLPLASTGVSGVVFRKFCRVFGSLYLSSQFFKLPKLFAALALVPVSQRVLHVTRRRLKWSETRSTILLVCGLFLAWSGIVAVPILAEYTQLRRFTEMERWLSIHHVVPAFYAIPRLALQEC